MVEFTEDSALNAPNTIKDKSDYLRHNNFRKDYEEI